MVHSSPGMRRPDLLDLNEVLQHPGKKIEVDVATELGGESDVELLGELEGALEAVSTGNLLLLTGRFAARAILECARCSAPIEIPVEFEVDEQFTVEGVAAGYGTGDYARVVADEPFPLFDGNSLLVDSLLRQDLIVSIPMQPLCQYGWDGPCPNALAAGMDRGREKGRFEFAKLTALKMAGNIEAEDAGP